MGLKAYMFNLPDYIIYEQIYENDKIEGIVSLKRYIRDCSISIHKFLEVAAGLTEVLIRIHQKGIIHGNLKPDNILINPNTGKVYITDFSNAVLLDEKNKNTRLPGSPSGTLEYMSPEQTGRLNTGIDCRSDLYSLGVILYETITGCLPLQAESPAGWINAHITQKPQPPDKNNPDIPPVISLIIMKLLSKAVEERYQSAYGLLRDLKECQRLLNHTGKIEHFSIGQADALYLFRLPGKFYGREEEKKILKDSFNSAHEGKTVTVLVNGYPGIGKTMLINESLKSISQGKGFFLTGKFDQLKKNIPYAPLADAFGNLVRQLMTENREELERWKKKILYSLGRNAAVITGIIPELEYIVGKQPPVDELPPKEAENRFLMVFRDFIGVFALKGHPLVLFMDDLQWADSTCIHLLKYLTRDANLHSLLFIGSFRDNEINAGHPLKEMTEETYNEQTDMKHIYLMPLKWNDACKLVAETVHTSPENAADLSEVLYRKSGGNPFFLGQMLMLIHNEGHIYFDMQEGCWKWELETIKKLQPGEDVLELLIKKIQNLPEETCEIMKIAACIGNRFDLKTLAFVYGKPPEETTSFLVQPLLERLIVTLESENIGLHPEYKNLKHSVFEFLHDGVQQAVYSLIPENEKKEKHLLIGRLFMQNTDPGNLDEKILPTMDHFNRSLELITHPEERIKLAEYNLMAGRKVKASAAYASALKYFRYGKVLLTEYSWEHAYSLSYDLHLELAQAEYLSSNVKTAEELFDTLLEKSGTELERAGIYSLKIILYAGAGKYDESVRTGIRVLKNLGVKLPLNPAKLDYAKELLLFKWHMRNKKIEELLCLPEMEDPVHKKIAELLARMCSVTMNSHPDLHGFIILKTGNYAASYGNSEITSVGYLGYSITAGNILGDYKAGSRYGEVCIRLIEKYDRSFSKCIIYFVIGAFVSHWTSHASLSLDCFKKSIQSAMEAGDVLIMGYAHCLLLETRYLIGAALTEIEDEIREKQIIAKRLKHDSLAVNVAIYQKLISALKGGDEDSSLSGAEFEEDELLQLVKNDKPSLATLYLYRMLLYYMAGNYRKALSAAQLIEPLAEALIGFMTSAEYNFYYSLSITALYRELPLKERKCFKKVLKKNQRQMKKWSEACKENFEHKFLLVEAETARFKSKEMEAMILYDRAILSAEENSYIQNEALANELAAGFYLSKGLTKIAKTYMIDACSGYDRWGASAKAKELKSRYYELLGGTDSKNQNNDAKEGPENTSIIPTPSYMQTPGNMDMYFIDKAIESISMETDINKLLESFLSLAAQSIGADRGYLILEKNGELFIEAIKDNNTGSLTVQAIPVEDNDKLSKAVVRYVARASETVVLNCEDQIGIFASDPYISQSNAKSIACVPLLLQRIPFGLLYFENSFISGIFAPGRLEFLKLLSLQIAYVKKLQQYLETDKEEKNVEEGLYLVDPLTEREAEVLNLIAEGMSNKEISDSLKISINTVKVYIKNIYEKLKVNRRVQVVTKAKELKLLKKN
ncbi:serine/threonine-protein kinase PknB [Oxobacter pfennigii]|uniref:Serine/threonine-protein kinase PknB n=1 Tax=Oxobacter pfennigii TaxID=36849 RepID=A0A0N8NT32_9CLOT|nr:AAA family ATPase [Oxobacter pfennigii]KPU43704.1 serine/threonine-protein kinase PknB [Oxobacter pfennigii]